MCDGGKVKVPFEPITIENEKIISTPLFLPYTDLESRESGTLSSFGTTEMTFDSITFDPIGYQCLLENSVETNAIMNIKGLRTGPYQSSGFSLNFKRLFFFAKDLIIFTKVRFVYNPENVCKDISGSKVYMIIDNIRGIEYADFYVTDGLNNESRNPTFVILDYLFKEHSTHFGLFWDSVLNTILQGSEINELILKEFERTYCEHKKLYGDNSDGHGGDDHGGEDKGGEDKGTEDKGTEDKATEEKARTGQEQEKNVRKQNTSKYHEKLEKIKSMDLYSILFKSK